MISNVISRFTFIFYFVGPNPPHCFWLCWKGVVWVLGLGFAWGLRGGTVRLTRIPDLENLVSSCFRVVVCLACDVFSLALSLFCCPLIRHIVSVWCYAYIKPVTPMWGKVPKAAPLDSDLSRSLGWERCMEDSGSRSAAPTLVNHHVFWPRTISLVWSISGYFPLYCAWIVDVRSAAWFRDSFVATWSVFWWYLHASPNRLTSYAEIELNSVPAQIRQSFVPSLFCSIILDLCEFWKFAAVETLKRTLQIFESVKLLLQ